MRNRVILLFLAVFGTIMPAMAQQQSQTLERRVGRIEQDLRTVQRRVFPTGVPSTIDPELQQPTTTPTRPTGSGGDAITTLNGRIEALEAQLARVTGQVEENGYRLGQLEEQVRGVRSELEARIVRLEQAAAPPAPRPQQPVEPVAVPEATQPSTPTSGQPLDRVQAAYNDGYRLWETRRYAEAVTALNAVADGNPRNRWASWARNLAGRAYLDDNQPANAAQTFLQNYQDNPRGERAADSLFFLGDALVKLNRRAEACPVYDELASKFPDMRTFLRERLPAARRAARCTG